MPDWGFMGWKRHYEKTNPVCSSRLRRASALVSFWLCVPCCVVSCDLLDGRRDGGLKDAWIQGWRRRERVKELPSGEFVIVRTERHALRRADKKQLHVLKEKKVRNKHTGKNMAADGEGDGYRNIWYADPPHTHTVKSATCGALERILLCHWGGPPRFCHATDVFISACAWHADCSTGI